jgi:hypothetical protein
MLQDRSILELTCKNGHKSEHFRDRGLRLQDAWCSTCGADIAYNPDEEGNALPKAA